MSKFKVDENGLPLPCSIEGCIGHVKVKKYLLCSTHYSRFWRDGSLDQYSKVAARTEPVKCEVSNCSNTVKRAPKLKTDSDSNVARYCASHLTRLNTRGTLDEEVEVRYMDKVSRKITETTLNKSLP